MTAVSSSSVATVSNVGGLAGHGRAERLGALDRRGGGRVGGDHEEVLAAVGLLEARRAPPAPIGSSGGALEAEVGLRVGVVEVVGDLAAP